MSRPFQVEISQSKEMLEKALKYATTASSEERLQMLYLLKSDQVLCRRELAELIEGFAGRIWRGQELEVFV